MDLSAWIPAGSLRWSGLLAVLCGAIGVAAGVHPTIGLEVAIGLIFAVTVLSNLAVGVCLFTALAFLEVISAAGSVIKLAGLLLFISWAATLMVAPERVRPSWSRTQPMLACAAVALISWTAISIAWAHSHGAAATATERFFLNILLLPIVFGAVRRREHLLWILTSFVVAAAASGTYGLLTSSPDGRLTGTVGDPNEEAAVLLAGIVLAVALAAIARRGSLRRTAFCVAIGVMAVALLSTGSRGGLIAAGGALAAGVVAGGRWRRRALAMLTIGGAATVLFVTALAPAGLQQHLSSADSTGRTDLWKVGLRMFEANPVLGVGAGNFATEAIHYVAKSGPLRRADLIVDAPKVAHNAYLQLLDELGPFGLSAFLLIAVASLGTALSAARAFERTGDLELELVARMVMLALVGVLVADFFISNEYSKQLWLLLALPPGLRALAGASGRPERV